MKLSDTFLTATQNLNRRKVRTVLTSVGVFVGILTIVTMVSLGVGIQQQITDTIKAFGLQTVFVSPRLERPPAGAGSGNTRQRTTNPISSSVVDRFKADPGVESVEVVLSIPEPPEMSLTVDGKTFPLGVRSPNPQARVFQGEEALVAGKALTNLPGEKGLMLTQRMLKSAGYSQDPAQLAGLVGKAATINITAPRGDKQSFQTTIVGVSSGTFGAGAELGNGDAAAIKEWWYNDPNILQTDGYDAAVIHTKSLGDATRISGEVQNQGFQSATLQTILDQVNRIFAILQTMLSSVGLLALLVASIGIANTMIMAIYERTREIGILKALGSSNGDVLRMFMVEAGLIGLLGGIVGVLGGWGLGLLLNVIIRGYLQREQIPITAPFFVVTWDLIVEALIFSTIIGIVAGLYPAFRAARLDPLAALRHE